MDPGIIINNYCTATRIIFKTNIRRHQGGRIEYILNDQEDVWLLRRNQDAVLGLYKSLVSSHLEYCSGLHVWSPYLRQDIDKFQMIQNESSQIKAFN